MPLPNPAAIAYFGQGNLFQTAMKFSQGERTWTEKWFCIVKGNTTNPNLLMTYAGGRLANQRKIGLAANAQIIEVRSSLVASNPATPTKGSFPGDGTGEGAGVGSNVSAAYSPTQKAWEWAFYESSGTLKSIRPFRAFATTDDTWNFSGFYDPSPKINAMIAGMMTVLAAPQAQTGITGNAQYVIGSNAYIADTSPLILNVNNPLTTDAYGRIVFSVTGTVANPNGIQFGWLGQSGYAAIRPAVIGDLVHLSGNRQKCLKGVNTTYRIVNIVISSTFPNQVYTYTTSKFACCSTSALGQWNGTVRAVQDAYYAIATSAQVQIATHNTGSSGGPRGKAKAGCC